ncbi:hypothetical protein ACIBG8_16300 [Nonomuraea sp. NPDC050556]|uniref:hypothetical protein n=1 Tax=Nonomuraea sp. NPDC050556 TaxID=3364369 RepID=UPI00379E3B91
MRWMIPPVVLLLALLSCSPATGDPPATVAAKKSDGTESPCGKVVSAIGYAAFSLVPAGQEESQKFDDDARGRLSYVWGTVQRYGPQLPQALQQQQETLRRTTQGLSPADTPHEEQVKLLREYRAAAEAVTKGCA